MAEREKVIDANVEKNDKLTIRMKDQKETIKNQKKKIECLIKAINDLQIVVESNMLKEEEEKSKLQL